MPITPERMAQEKRLRIRLAVAAYDYEIMNGILGLMTDNEFDFNCQQVSLDIPTGSPPHDKWWIDNFDPSTGQWVYHYPDHVGLARIWHSLRSIQIEGKQINDTTIECASVLLRGKP
jgi:hypothetical protein